MDFKISDIQCGKGDLKMTKMKVLLLSFAVCIFAVSYCEEIKNELEWYAEDGDVFVENVDLDTKKG